MATDFFMGVGDRLPLLTNLLEDENGPITLTGYSVTVYARKAGGTTVFSGSATVDPDQVNNKGSVSYSWGTSDTQVPGLWFTQWKAVTSGKTVTFPNTGADSLWINEFWGGVNE